jgi:hypothetical protein
MTRAAVTVAVVGLLALGAPARAECDAKEISDLVTVSEQAFTAMDAEGFEAAASRLDQSILCQREPLSPIQVASYHRVHGLAAFFAADELGTVLSFQAVLSTMPGYLLPLEIAPEGHPLRQRYEEAKLFAAGETFELPEPAEGWITVDGTRTRRAPASRPFVFQRLGGDGAVVETRYIGAGTPVPSYPEAVAAAVVRAPLPAPLPAPVSRQPNRVNGGLVGTGLVLGAASAGMYGASFLIRDQYDAAVIAGDEDRIRARYWTTNGLLGGAVGAAGIGATCLLVGVF